MPDNFIFMAFYFVLSKGSSLPICDAPYRAYWNRAASCARPSLRLYAVYANSFYAALNTRRSVRGRGTENDQTTVATFLMVGQTTTFKNENPGPGGPTYSTVRVL